MISMQTGKPKISRNLAATLVIAFVSMSLAALLIAYVPQFFFFLKARQESINSQQQSTAQEAASTVASFVQEKFSKLETVIKIGKPTSASQEEQRKILANLLGIDPAFRQLVLLDSQERELAKVSRLSQTASGRLVDRAGGGWFAQVKQGNRYISPVYVDEVTSEPMMIVAVPVTDVFGDFQGILLAEVNLKFMWDLVDRLKVGETGLAYVVDRQGDLIAFGDISRVLKGDNVSHLDLVGEFVHDSVPVGGVETSVVHGIDGTAVIGTYVPLGEPDWAVVTELPTSEAYRPTIQSTTISVVVMLVGAALIGLGGVYVARRLAAPLLNLTATVGRIAGGEMDLQAATEGPTEVVDLARAFNSMTVQLRELVGNLEQRVADRTRNLQTAADVSRATTSVLDPDQLLRQTVDLVRERFDLYYVGLFLVDEDRRFAVLRAGSGEAGQQMLARGHQLEVGGDSMIGQCVARDEARIALDVGEEAIRFDNPFLPRTRSEMALPLRSRGRVIGAMTVQSTQAAAFDASDIAVVQTMADQVAVAIDNARLFADAERLFAESQAALQEVEAAHRHYLGQAWAEYVRSRAARGYQYSKEGKRSEEHKQPEGVMAPLGAEILPEVRQAMTVQHPVVRKDNGGTADHAEESSSSALVAPIMLRGQPIGALGLRRAAGDWQWSTDDVALAEAIAEQFALAADNLRLLEETQRRAARERLVGEVTSRVRETMDVEAVLKTAADEMRQALGLDRVVVRLGVADSHSRDG
jgi:GAF domain-containing protein/HAMP domain-containing protein